MTKEQNNVKEFMSKRGQLTPDKPTIPDELTRLSRARLHLEEVTELIVQGLAVGFNFELLADGKIKWDVWTLKQTPSLTEIADGVADLGFVGDGTALACGLDMEPLRAEVDSNNLSKKGYLDEHGKFIKEPGHLPPNLTPLIEAQQNAQPS